MFPCRDFALPSLLAAALLATPVLAQEGPASDDSAAAERAYSLPLGGPSRSHANMPPPDFAEADLNGDGLLDLAEAKAALPADMPLLDENEDGVFSYLELQNALPQLHLDPAMGKVVSGDLSGIGEAEYQELLEALRDYNNKAREAVIEKE